MVDTIARVRSGKLIFETMVDLDAAMRLKRGEQISISDVIRDNAIYLDQKKGMRAGAPELQNVFGTADFALVVEQIVKKGAVEDNQEFREGSLEKRKKQVVDFLVRNAIDVGTRRPFLPEMLSNSIRDAGIKIEDKPVETQINDIVDKLKKVLPIKIETKKIRIKLPAMHTGRVYGFLKEYKERENWLENGDLVMVLNIPVGIQMEFYDKLNAATQGSAVTEEVREEQ